MADSIKIDRGAPDGAHYDVLSILYDVASEVRESRLGDRMDWLHKYGGGSAASHAAGRDAGSRADMGGSQLGGAQAALGR